MNRTSTLSALGMIWIVSFATAPPATAQQKTIIDLTQANHLITTHGNYESRVTPNKVTVIFTLKTFDKAVTTAYDLNAQSAQKLASLAEGIGIGKGDVQTSQIAIEPEYSYEQGRQVSFKPVGFTCNRTVTFVLMDASKLDTLLKAGLQEGASGIQSVSFDNTDAPKYRAAARIAALKAAQEKAQALAEAVGCKVGKPVAITEGFSSFNNPAGTWLTGASNGTIAPQGADSYVGNNSQGLELGKLDISADVTATFELE